MENAYHRLCKRLNATETSLVEAGIVLATEHLLWFRLYERRSTIDGHVLRLL